MADFIIAHHKGTRPIQINILQEKTQPAALLKLLRVVYGIDDATTHGWPIAELLRWAKRQHIFISKPAQSHTISFPLPKVTR